jgi:hypothetical protein
MGQALVTEPPRIAGDLAVWLIILAQFAGGLVGFCDWDDCAGLLDWSVMLI